MGWGASGSRVFSAAEHYGVPGRQVELWSTFIPVRCVSFPFVRLYPIYPRDLIYHDKGKKKNPLSFNNIISNVNSAGENYDSGCIVAGKIRNVILRNELRKRHAKNAIIRLIFTSNRVRIMQDKSARLILAAHTYV